MSFDVIDRPGVLARCAAIFGDHGVSLRVVQQNNLEAAGPDDAEPGARLGVMTHLTREHDLSSVVSELEGAEFVASDVRVMRVEGF